MADKPDLFGRPLDATPSHRHSAGARAEVPDLRDCLTLAKVGIAR